MEEQLEDIAQWSGAITYNEAWAIKQKAEKDLNYKAVVNNVICKWRDAINDDDDEKLSEIARELKAIVP